MSSQLHVVTDFHTLSLQDVRRAYRELFYTAPIGDYISGAIMYKVTCTMLSDVVPLNCTSTDAASFVYVCIVLCRF